MDPTVTQVLALPHTNRIAWTASVDSQHKTPCQVQADKQALSKSKNKLATTQELNEQEDLLPELQVSQHKMQSAGDCHMYHALMLVISA
jgi:hypothetical protein